MARIRYNHETKVWDDILEGEEHSDFDIVIDNKRRKYLDIIKKELMNDFDHTEIISGSVGAGKSTLGRLDCRYVSNERFHPKTHIIRDVNDIKHVIKNASKGDAILVDEGSGIFSSTDTMTKKTKYANYVLDVCRQKNLLIVILHPYFHRLTQAVAIDRAKTLTRVYVDEDTGKRGKFAFYGTGAKCKLYHHAKKNFGDMRGIRPTYRGRFTEDKTFTDEYKKVKDETLDIALNSLNPEKDRPPRPQDIILKHNIDIVRNNPDKTAKQLADLMKVTTRTIENYRQRIRIEDSENNQNSQNTNQLNSPKPESRT